MSPWAIGPYLADGDMAGPARRINPGDTLHPDEVEVEEKPEDDTYPFRWAWSEANKSLRPPTDEDQIRWAVQAAEIMHLCGIEVPPDED